MTLNRPRCAIVGGGIGGMSVAVALRNQGFEVVVFEQAAELGEIGAGVLLTPNGVRALNHLGLGQAVAESGGRVGAGSHYYRMDGTAIAPIVTTDSTGWNGMFGMHRADLLSILASTLPADAVRAGHKCIGFEQDTSTCRLAFENGESVDADVVIAADGIQSVLKQYVAEPSDPIHSGSVAYRGLLRTELLAFWPEGVSRLWMGDGKHFLVYPVRRGELLNYVGFVPSPEETRESWSAPGDPAKLAEAFRGWDPDVEVLLSKVESTFWWGLYDREPLTRWTSGRLALLGDAAHPMLPHVGQGANLAIEDGVALAEILSDADASTVSSALVAFEELRRKRATRVQAGARANGLRYDSAYEDLDQRDAEIADSAQFRLWLYDYDAVAEAQCTH